jgi:hypothetical protein
MMDGTTAIRFRAVLEQPSVLAGSATPIASPAGWQACAIQCFPREHISAYVGHNHLLAERDCPGLDAMGSIHRAGYRGLAGYLT